MVKTNIAILFGGASSEHDVSLISATSVLRNISKKDYTIHMVGITKSGRWIYYTGPVEQIVTGEWETHSDNLYAFISPDPCIHGLSILTKAGIQTIPLDAVFPVLHGKNGEDGTLQGLLAMANIPFVGCSAAASAVCMDKIYTNMVLDWSGILQAKWLWITAADFLADPNPFMDQVEGMLGFPVFVKPANAGSSVGVGKAVDRDSFMTCMKLAARHDRRILIEEGIDGQEVECAVLGNREPIASVVGEIVPCNDFYDYDAKYHSESGLYVPAKISDDAAAEIQKIAVTAYRALGCEGMARVDFFVRRHDGAILLNEPNTIPGFTSISMYPKLFEASGIAYPDLIDRLIMLAIERADQ